MVLYVQDENTGIVHIVNNSGCGEFTFCYLEFGCGGNGISDEFIGSFVKGPSDCEKCKQEVDGVRHSLKGARFKSSGLRNMAREKDDADWQG